MPAHSRARGWQICRLPMLNLMLLFWLFGCDDGPSGTLTPNLVTTASEPFTATLTGPSRVNVGSCGAVSMTAHDVNNNLADATSGGFNLSNFGAATVTPLVPVTFSARSTLNGSVCATHNAFLEVWGYMNLAASNRISLDLGSPVVSVRISPAAPVVKIGTPLQLSAAPVDSFGNTASRLTIWGSANPGIVTVTPGGLITAVSVGTTTIYATIQGKLGTAPVATNISGGSISGPGTISTSGTYSWTANPIPSGNYTYVWDIVTYGNDQHFTRSGRTISLTVGASTGSISLLPRVFLNGVAAGNIARKVVGNTIGGACGGKIC